MNSEGTAGDENIIVENIITPNDGEDFGIFDSSKIESEVINNQMNDYENEQSETPEKKMLDLMESMNKENEINMSKSGDRSSSDFGVYDQKLIEIEVNQNEPEPNLMHQDLNPEPLLINRPDILTQEIEDLDPVESPLPVEMSPQKELVLEQEPIELKPAVEEANLVDFEQEEVPSGYVVLPPQPLQPAPEIEPVEAEVQELEELEPGAPLVSQELEQLEPVNHIAPQEMEPGIQQEVEPEPQLLDSMDSFPVAPPVAHIEREVKAVVNSTRRASSSSESSRSSKSRSRSPSPVRKSPAKSNFFTKNKGQCKIFRNDQLNDIVAWKDLRKSGIIFSSSLSLLLLLSFYPVLYLLSNLALISIIGAIFTKLYFKIVSKIKGDTYVDPFESYLKGKTFISHKNCEKSIQAISKAFSEAVLSAQKLVFGSDLNNSFKFAGSLYLWTKISKWFSGITLLILIEIAVFSIPKIYEKNYLLIDEYVNQMNEIIDDVIMKMNVYLPEGWRIRVKND